MNKIEYVGDGQNMRFAFDFPFFDLNDVCVYVNNKQITSGFVVEFIKSTDIPYQGTYIVFDIPPRKTDIITISRNIKLVRHIDYQSTAKIDPEKLNQDLNFAIEVLKEFKQTFMNINEKYAEYADLPNIESVINMTNATIDAIDNLDLSTIVRTADLNTKAGINADNFSSDGKELLSQMAMPSDNYIELDLDASWNSVIAPANGYITLDKDSGTGSADQYISLENKNSGFRSISHTSASGTGLAVYVPCKKGDSVQYGYTATGTKKAFRFIYAQGEL